MEAGGGTGRRPPDWPEVGLQDQERRSGHHHQAQSPAHGEGDMSSSRESILMKSSRRWHNSILCDSCWLTQWVRDGRFITWM
jgi:hypothetical protein